MRAKHPVAEAIEQPVETMVAAEGYELVEITLGGPKRNPVLTVVIDKPGGVTADDCATVSRRLNVLLDVLDPIPTTYQLAVASPGLERPLTKPADFVRFAGRGVAVRFADETGQRQTKTGELLGMEQGVIRLRVGEEELRIPEEQAESAHLTFSWEDLEAETESETE